jgi:hypothetical protein
LVGLGALKFWTIERTIQSGSEGLQYLRAFLRRRGEYRDFGDFPGSLLPSWIRDKFPKSDRYDDILHIGTVSAGYSQIDPQYPVVEYSCTYVQIPLPKTILYASFTSILSAARDSYTSSLGLKVGPVGRDLTLLSGILPGPLK